MNRTVLLSAVVVGALATGALSWAIHRAQPVSVKLSDGKELRVLKVTFGTNHVFSPENMWKRGLRRLAPGPAKKFLGPPHDRRYTSAHESLMLWVAGFDPAGNRVSYGLLDDPATVLTDGTIAMGKVYSGDLNDFMAIRYDTYARDQSRLTFLVRDRTNQIRFALRNPHSSQPAQWNSLPLPQTNHGDHTAFILTQVPPIPHPRGPSWSGAASWYGGTYFWGRALAKAFPAATPGDDGQVSKAGWMEWRVTVIDRFGNWEEGEWANQNLLIPALVVTNSTWRLQTQPREYLSAGFVAECGVGKSIILPLNPRIRQLGVRFAAYVGPGSHTIHPDTRGFSLNSTTDFSGLPSLESPPNTDAFKVSSPSEGILFVAEVVPNGPGLDARIRERNERNEGKVFSKTLLATAIKNQSGNSRLIAHYIVPESHSPAKTSLSNSTNRLEVEIIATHPAVSFFIEPPVRRE